MTSFKAGIDGGLVQISHSEHGVAVHKFHGTYEWEAGMVPQASCVIKVVDGCAEIIYEQGSDAEVEEIRTLGFSALEAA